MADGNGESKKNVEVLENGFKDGNTTIASLKKELGEKKAQIAELTLVEGIVLAENKLLRVQKAVAKEKVKLGETTIYDLRMLNNKLLQEQNETSQAKITALADENGELKEKVEGLENWFEELEGAVDVVVNEEIKRLSQKGYPKQDTFSCQSRQPKTAQDISEHYFQLVLTIHIIPCMMLCPYWLSPVC